MKFLTFAFVINFVLVCWSKLDIILRVAMFKAMCLYGEMSSHTEFQLHILF